MLARRAADGGRGDPPARRRTTARTRWPPPRSAWRAAWTPRRSARGCATFAGVPHRLEEIGTVGGVSYVNDSKATNVASAEVGIRSFAGGVHLIAGGSEKGSDFTPLAAPVKERCEGRLPDRRDRAARCARRWRRPACRSTTRATSSARSRTPARPRRTGRRRAALARRARPMTNTARTRSAETISARLVAHAPHNRRKASGGVVSNGAPMGSKAQQPLEHRLLLTATFCLLAGGAVMVYSASSARTLLAGPGGRHVVPDQVRRPTGRSGWSGCTSSRA